MAEYKSLMPQVSVSEKPEMLIFAHNDTQENNFLKKGNELRIIDFEYSQANFRGIDLTSLIFESAMSYAVEEPPKHKMFRDLFPDFVNVKENQINVDEVIQVYLTRFYKHHA